MPRAARPIRTASVLIPTWQGAATLERVLGALASQRAPLPFDVHVVDSGSTDRTPEILGRAAAAFPVPLAVRRIHKAEFDHGDTRNLLAALSGGDLLVYLTQDAIPTSPDWLARLAANFDDPAVGAATCRNVPRPDADPVTRVLCREDPGYAPSRRETRLPLPAEYERMDPHERRLLWSFNDVASAVRRELWELHPFPRTGFGEDVLMARALLEAGWTVVYDDEATVEHSHDYDEDETWERSRVDGRFNAEWLGRTCVASAADARALARRYEEPDARALAELGHGGAQLERLAARARRLRRAAFGGLHAGSVEGAARPRRSETSLLPRRELAVLYVVHGFPPDTWAGTEVYTLELAKETARRGHRVAVFARAPAASEEEPDFAVREEELQGLRVLRMTHRLAHRSLEESFRQPRAEEAFRRVLLAEKPDVVHFQHLIHTSIGLVEVARELGVPSVLHCHDYWALCARVQMIRPDGAVCPETMGPGCYACVKERALGAVPLLARAGSAAGRVLGALIEELGHRDFAELAQRHEAVPAAYAAADLLVSPSRFLREKLLATGRFDPDSFVFSDNGLRTDHVRALEKRPDPDGRLRVGFVGSLVWYKGGEVLLRAMARLRGLPVVLNVHGDFRPDEDPHHARLAELARRAGNARFHGRFDNARLSEVYAGIDVLVVPSLWYENSPITIREAYLTGTPVVASGFGGMAESVRDGVDGLHFRPGDDADLARALARLARDRELLRRLGRDLPRVKTIEEDAAAAEFRYRALACRRRARGAATLLDLPGDAAVRREGPVVPQGPDLLLLRPGGSAVEYDVTAVGSGERLLRVDVLALGGEGSVELGGRVLLDGEEVGRIAPFAAGGADETRSFAFAVRVPESGARRLRIEARIAAGGPEAHLRVRRVVVREPARERVA